MIIDAAQWRMGNCEEENLAVKVMTRVKGHYPKKGTILLDCGYTGLSLNGLNTAVVQGHPDLV